MVVVVAVVKAVSGEREVAVVVAVVLVMAVMMMAGALMVAVTVAVMVTIAVVGSKGGRCDDGIGGACCLWRWR